MFTLVLFFIGFFLAAFAIVIIYWRLVIEGALTSHFRAAERISEGYLPKAWARQINRRLTLSRFVFLPQRPRAGTKLALKKIDRLTRFFENNRFFEDEAAQLLLLDQLNATRQRWKKMTWEELYKITGPNS